MNNNGLLKDAAINKLISIATNAQPNVIAFEPPKKPQDEFMLRHKSGAVITPAELVIYGNGLQSDAYDKMLRRAKIDACAKYEKPPVLFTFDGYPLLSMQNISVISGKAKSRKSGFASVLAALTIAPNSNQTDWQQMHKQRLIAERPIERSGVLFFDTEQSEWHVSLMARRILHMADRNTNSGEVLRIYSLRDFNPSDRLQFIAETIERHADECGLVIIDGVRDVVMAINSEEEATLVNSWLLSITKRLNIHVCCVLHENKSADTLRGHLGTELQNKAEAVFTVTKGTTKALRDMSSVETSMARNKGMERIGMDTIEIEKDGHRIWIPAITDDGRADRIGKTNEESPLGESASITNDQYRDIIRMIWKDDPSAAYSPTDLILKVGTHGTQLLGISIGQNRARALVSHMLEIGGWIAHNGVATKGRKYTLRDSTILAEKLKTDTKIPF